MPTTTSTTRPGPLAPVELFTAFSLLALQGFGGVMAVVQRELVERRRWLSQEEFLAEWAVAQILPGPNVVNLSLMLGNRYFGLRGALASLAGMLCGPALAMLALSALYTQFAGHPAVEGALRGVVAVAAGLFIATGLKMTAMLRRHPLPLPLGLGMAAVGVICAVALRWPLPATLLALGGTGCCLCYWRLKP